MSATQKAKDAIRAARNVPNWGPEAAWRYAEIRGVSNCMFLAALHAEHRRLLRKKAARQYEMDVKVEAAERGISIKH